MPKSQEHVSVVIPTYRREQVLLDTIVSVQELSPPPAEVLVVDQTPDHDESSIVALSRWEQKGQIRWIHADSPSIPHAMNVGLTEARQEVVLFLDDDIIPDVHLIGAHAAAHRRERCAVVAGQVLQPGEAPLSPGDDAGSFRFCSSRRVWVSEFMGGNFSVNRKFAIQAGGFDENFVKAGYRFEADFADRVLAAGGRILFEPAACIKHLKVHSGGTRAFGLHLTTISPAHAVGAHYYALRNKSVPSCLSAILQRCFRAVRTKHHLRRPWWIPVTLIAELLGLCWAGILYLRGARLLEPEIRSLDK
ncbi:MAG TPA: glycosyltransferase family A protein [Acidobacteriota bacterium]|jgi:GT2 family glycosyltransferase